MCVEEATPIHRDVNNNIENALDLDAFDSEPGYFKQVIKPMLKPGHESELIYWLKNFGMLPNSQICPNSDKSEMCNKMIWIPHRSQDLYRWNCTVCTAKKSIRENSEFCDIKCNFKNVLRLLLGWCKGMDTEMMAIMLGIKTNIVCGLYNKAAKIAENHLRKNIKEFQLGGPNTIVLVDIYPTGCSNADTQNRTSRPILCLSEAKSFPQKNWFQTLEKCRNSQQVLQNKQDILSTIQQTVKPLSVLIVPQESQFCSYNDFQGLKQMYPTIITFESLQRHSTQQTTSQEVLEIIWSKSRNICEQAQFYNNANMQQFLTSQMWQRQYGEQAFQVLLHEFGVHQ